MQVCIAGLLITENISVVDLEAAKKSATEEADNWRKIYIDYVGKFKWDVRMEIWMGNPAVIMPRLDQFSSKQDRLDNLNAVAICLTEKFHKKGFIHTDIYWRNIGYFKHEGAVIVVMLDLRASRKLREGDDNNWVDIAIESLKARANLRPGSEENIS